MLYESDFNTILNNNKTLLKYEPLLKTLTFDGVMCVGFENDDFYIQECCDGYYRHKLNKEECVELSELFKNIAELMWHN